MILKNTDWFKKDGSYRKGKFRLYCQHDGCDSYIILRWGLDALGNGGYMAYDKDGDGIDVRNQCYVCKAHEEHHEKRLANIRNK